MAGNDEDFQRAVEAFSMRQRASSPREEAPFYNPNREILERLGVTRGGRLLAWGGLPEALADGRAAPVPNEERSTLLTEQQQRAIADRFGHSPQQPQAPATVNLPASPRAYSQEDLRSMIQPMVRRSDPQPQGGVGEFRSLIQMLLERL
jgi:hypothetical protein